MSKIAAWSYKNTAKVRPFVSRDDWNGTTNYGTEYEIACNWTANGEQVREMGGKAGAGGAEFVSKHIIYTEDARPKYLDLIMFDGSDGWEEIRAVMAWDMAMFNDTPDYKLAT
ncbi:hypothetical protein [Pusillimonas sp. ANT_WB101]|uniref:hypothetical protein n=1 Tax=Pusillimonas sp. ANT_WB101 TaxID=2597356 RepID=UPI0011ED4E4C|nr:hypothetical protein [Pusillimonas sp. ANT_WB101]KAA0910681.1 hypothetical protein FQ179_02050 [Pusillimonas sp. ANT_WB101]